MRARRVLPMVVLAAALTAASPAFASGGSGGGGGGGGGSTTTTTLSPDPCATVNATAKILNQGGGTSLQVSGTVTSCSASDETLYAQIKDTSGRLFTITLTPPNTAGGSCYICDSILASGKSWSYQTGWTVPADGWTYPISVTVLHRDTMDTAPVLLASTTTSITAPADRNT